MRALLLAVLVSGCVVPPNSPAPPDGPPPVCGECFRVLGDVCVDDGECPGSACATARPDLPAMLWTNDPGLNLHVDFGCPPPAGLGDGA